MKSTHRVFAEHVTSGQVRLMFRGDRAQCLQYWNEWANYQDGVKEEGDTRKYLQPGWIMYIAEVEADSVLEGQERNYRVLGRPLANSLRGLETRKKIIAAIDFGHPLVQRHVELYVVPRYEAVEAVRKDVYSIWLNDPISRSVEQVVEDKMREELDHAVPEGAPE